MKPMWPAVANEARRRGGLGALLGFWLILLTACRGAPPVVKIGFAGPFEGRHRAVGYDAIYSARLAIRQVNAAGGVGGYRLALMALDDRGDAAAAAVAARAFIADAAVVAVIGHWLPQTTEAAGALYAQAGVPFVAAGEPPYGPSDPEQLGDAFHAAYEEVTPFDEKAGPYAGPSYRAFTDLLNVLAEAAAARPRLDRQAVGAVLSNPQ